MVYLGLRYVHVLRYAALFGTCLGFACIAIFGPALPGVLHIYRCIQTETTWLSGGSWIIGGLITFIALAIYIISAMGREIAVDSVSMAVLFVFGMIGGIGIWIAAGVALVTAAQAYGAAHVAMVAALFFFAIGNVFAIFYAK